MQKKLERIWADNIHVTVSVWRGNRVIVTLHDANKLDNSQEAIAFDDTEWQDFCDFIRFGTNFTCNNDAVTYIADNDLERIKVTRFHADLSQVAIKIEHVVIGLNLTFELVIFLDTIQKIINWVEQEQNS